MKQLLKKSGVAVLPLAAVLVLGSQPVRAQTTAPTRTLQVLSDTPAATLLLPYFEVDLNNPMGKNTVFTINNPGEFTFTAGVEGGSSGSAVLAHVTVWTDLGVPVLGFNVYLTGYDVETINMRTVLLQGFLPQTASTGQDPADGISPKGLASQDINYASCTQPSPNDISHLPPAPMTAGQLTSLTLALTGQPVPAHSGTCAALNYHDNIARGYVTIDTVNNCTPRNPGDPGYFAFGGGGDTTNQNQLTGEVFYIDASTQVARSGNLVHIHADDTDPLVTTPNAYTFYGTQDGFSANDNRQPLATNFAARYNPSTGLLSAFTTATPASLIVWRDPKVGSSFFTCGLFPQWYPLNEEGVVAFDEQEHPALVAYSGQMGLAPPFPARTQIVQIGGSALPTPYPSGWLYMDLNAIATGQMAPAVPMDSAASQAWVQVLQQVNFPTNGAPGYLTLHNGQQMDSGTSPIHFVP